MPSKYQIRADDKVLADLTHEEYVYYNGKLKTGINIAGSLSFSLMPNNPVVSSLMPLKSTITLRRNGKTIWSGRIIQTKKNIYNQYDITCEGALSWLYDIMIPPTSFKNTTVGDIVSSIIGSYNSLCSANRLFVVGEIEDENIITLSQKEDYISVFDILKEIVSINGGYFIVTYQENGAPILNYYNSGLDTPNEIRFGENLLDINEYIDKTKIITSLYAVGNGVELPAPKYIENENAVESYGRIFGFARFDDISDQAELITQATNYLNQNILGDISIKVKAIAINWDANAGYNVRVISKHNGIDVNMIISEVVTDLNNEASGYITIGSSQKTLTKKLALEGK